MVAKSLPDAVGRGGAASLPSDPPRSSPVPERTQRFRLPRCCRLVRRKDYEAVYQGGKRRAGPLAVVFCRPNGLRRIRFGTSAGRQLGTAVERNRIRRRVREVVRLHHREFTPGWDIVIQPRRSVGRAAFASLEKELVEQIRSLTGS
ncbi:MAG TPA: ribonuclease P protein component [Candidatus Acidoferrales bacterium]|nr:ribonuclease P protein component [Candidatus Acidoferrales bacterium]